MASPNRVNARHSDRKITNVLLFDGHAESLRTADIPGGYMAVNGTSGSFSARRT